MEYCHGSRVGSQLSWPHRSTDSSASQERTLVVSLRPRRAWHTLLFYAVTTSRLATGFFCTEIGAEDPSHLVTAHP